MYTKGNSQTKERVAYNSARVCTYTHVHTEKKRTYTTAERQMPQGRTEMQTFVPGTRPFCYVMRDPLHASSLHDYMHS